MVEALRSALPPHLQSHLASAREMVHRHTAASASTFPTTVEALDGLLTGGLHRGQMVELMGERSSGRFSTVLAILAAATSAGEAVALVDLGDGLDPHMATATGIDLERLLWVRPRRLKEALISAEMLLAGGFPLVILDLGHPPVPGGRGLEAAWLRLARAAQGRDAVVLVSSPYRVSGTAATGVVRAGRGRPRWCAKRLAPPLLVGLSSQLTLEKLRGHQGTDNATLEFVTPEAAVFAAVELAPARRGDARAFPTDQRHPASIVGMELALTRQEGRSPSPVASPCPA